MSSTILELTRATHEEVERLERLIVEDLRTEPRTDKERFYQSHRVRNMIELITQGTHKLVEIYEDKDNTKKDEIEALDGQTAAGSNMFGEFYDRLKEIREYHRRNPDAGFVDVNGGYDRLLKEEPQVEFSGEEGFGRYLDLHELFNDYINSKFGEPIEYTAYLDVFSQLHKNPAKIKFTGRYKGYLQKLLDYLISFFERTEPLQDLDRVFSRVAAEFEEQWTNRNVQGWENEAQEKKNVPLGHVIDLDYFSTVEELMGVGAEKLKEALAAAGLKTGGTLKQRAERFFHTKHTPLEQLDKKYFANCHGTSNQNGALEIALMEAKAKTLCDLLEETILRTKEYAERKQALTWEEIQAERVGEAEQAEPGNDDGEDDEQQIYNPKELPMGWDGKPIPYWLYKLHGLHQEFRCEICGDEIYKGRRAYERHFKEWRHQHGMRCLGIPNTKKFNEITSIEEAKQLWEKIQKRQGSNQWRPDLEEEYEDQEGNIYSKRTYTDLQRQGLI